MGLNLNININGAKKGLATSPVPTDFALTVLSDTEIQAACVTPYAWELWRSATQLGTYAKVEDVAKGTGNVTNDELTAGTIYWYKARAVNGSKYSDFTSAVSAVTSNTVSFTSKVIEDAAQSSIVLTLSSELDESFVPATTAFVLSGGKTVTNVAIAGEVITLTVNTPYVYGNVPTVAYTKPATNYLRLANGSATNSWNASAVTNNVLYRMILTGTGDFSGVSTLAVEVSSQITFTMEGSARFYTDAAGTTGESTTWSPTSGSLRTIYLKCPTGNHNVKVSDTSKWIKLGNSSSSNHGWVSSTNAAKITFTPVYLPLTELRITGTCEIIGSFPTGLTYLNLGGNSIAWTYNGSLPTGLTLLLLSGNSIAWTYSGSLPTGLTFLLLNGNSIAWTYSGALPTGLTYLSLTGNLIGWTGLDIGNNGNIGTFSLLNYRVSKMSSADMVTLLTQMTNRTGTLPSTITINDYADYASPPAEVVTAVNTLKSTKSVSVVNLGA